jgi:hypothetical protein
MNPISPDDQIQYEKEDTNEDDYDNDDNNKKQFDYLYTPSFDTELASSLPILNFMLTYGGMVDSIEFGIGLDDNLFNVIR